MSDGNSLALMDRLLQWLQSREQSIQRKDSNRKGGQQKTQSCPQTHDTLLETAGVNLMVTVAAGVDKECQTELKDVFALPKSLICCSKGKIVFQVQEKYFRPEILRSLKCCESVWLVLERLSGDCLTRWMETAAQRDVQNQLHRPKGSVAPVVSALASWLANSPHWGKCLQRLFRCSATSPILPSHLSEFGQLRFRVSCKRGGQFGGDKADSRKIAAFVGCQLNNQFGWEADMQRPQVHVQLYCGDDEVLVCVALLRQTVAYSGHISCRGLKSDVSWAISQTATIQPGEVVLDPMCGRAVLLVEAARCHPLANYIGADISQAQLAGARSNVRTAGLGLRFPLVLAHAAAMPIQNGSVQVVLCDLPFGHMHGSVEENLTLYPLVVREMARVLQPSRGRAVLLTNAANALLLYRLLTNSRSQAKSSTLPSSSLSASATASPPTSSAPSIPSSSPSASSSSSSAAASSPPLRSPPLSSAPQGDLGRWSLQGVRKIMLGKMESYIFYALRTGRRWDPANEQEPEAEEEEEERVEDTVKMAQRVRAVDHFWWETKFKTRMSWKRLRLRLRPPMEICCQVKPS